MQKPENHLNVHRRSICSKLSAFNPDLVKEHTIHTSDSDIVQELFENFEAYSENMDLNPEDMVSNLTGALQIYINNNYQTPHVAPKFLALSLIFQKIAHEYATALAISSVDIINMRHIESLHKDMQKMLNKYGINYEAITGSTQMPAGLSN